jgi:hypothetical protein
MTTTSIGELGRALAEFAAAHKADVIAAADLLAGASDDATWNAAGATWATQRVNLQLQETRSRRRLTARATCGCRTTATRA